VTAAPQTEQADFTVLVLAKAPVAGRAKTRLGADVGHDAAARVAAAALLDTLEAATTAVGAERCVLALEGDLAEGVAGPEIQAALTGWTVVPQDQGEFDARLVRAHDDAGAGVVVQVAMDTPQVTPALLAGAAAPVLAGEADAVLGPAPDGGWWVLARRAPEVARALRGVPMSTPTTYADTRAALEAAGHRVVDTDTLMDVDTTHEADTVAAAAPGTRFARTWTSVRGAR